jgi:hypothetical protein
MLKPNVDLEVQRIDANLKLFCNNQLIPSNWQTESNNHVWCFNPSLIRINEEWLFVYRIILSDQKRRLALCRLDNHFNVIEDSILGLSDFIQFAPEQMLSERVTSWFADPRVFWLGNMLFIYFNSGWHEPFNHQFIVQINPITFKPLNHARQLCLRGDRQKIEKNWMLFGNDPYYAIYSANPHCIMRVNLKGLNEVWCEKMSIISLPDSEYLLSISLRGGAPPTQYASGEYYSFCHSLHQTQEGVRYEASAYRFSSYPPFYPTYFPKKKLHLPSPQGNNRSLPQLNPAVDEVIYPCGAAFHDGLWFISYGINDEVCAIAWITQELVDNSMQKIIY